MAHPPAEPALRRRAIALAVTVGVIALSLTSCSFGSSDDGAEERGGKKGATTTASAQADDEGPEVYRGSVAGFYEVPDPLPKGEPGELIRVQQLGEEAGVRTVRVMYHSRDAEDRDRAVTGIISHPTGDPPEGGWPVTSQANGTVGLAPKCAPSRSGSTPLAWGVEGVHAVTDYVGLGPVGEIHPYLSGPSEANSVIDAVRAARNLPGSHAGKRWLAIGHSQGGHAALFAGQRAAERAPELDLLGTVALAPGTELAKTYGPADEVVSRIVGAMMLYGATSEHPEIRFEDYAGPGLLAVEDVFEEGCVDDIIDALSPIPADRFWANDPIDTEPAKGLLPLNQPGLEAGDAPLLLAQGTEDEIVNVQRTIDFFERVCELGQSTRLLVLRGTDHGSIVLAAAPTIARWLNDRLAGRPAVDSCP